MLVIDQVLGIPGQYAFKENSSGINQFNAFRNAVALNAFNEDQIGFMAFAPAGNSGFFKETQTSSKLQNDPLSLFNNYVRLQ